MPRCPNCSYLLVLLEQRMKYKCAKCSRLWKQKFIEDKEFREWNRKQRNIDRESLQQRKPRLSEAEKKKRAMASARKWRLENPEKARQIGRLSSKRRYWRHHEQELERRKLWRERSKEKDKAYYMQWPSMSKEKRKLYLEKYRKLNAEPEKLKHRLGYWRNKQKSLALQMLRNEPYSLSEQDLREVLPTYLLAHLLS